MVGPEAHGVVEEGSGFRVRNLVKDAENVRKAVASKQTELFPASLPESNGKPAQAKAAPPKARESAAPKAETSKTTPKAQGTEKKTEAKGKAEDKVAAA